MILEINTLKQSISENDLLNQESQRSKEDAISRLTKCQNELQASLNIQEDLRNEFETSKAEIHRLQEEIKSLKKDLSNGKERASKLREESISKMLQFESKYNQITYRLQESEEELDKMRNTLISFELKNKSLKSTELYLTKKVNEHVQIIKAVENERDIAMAKVLHLQRELDSSYKKQEDFARKLGLKYYNARENSGDDKREGHNHINDANEQCAFPTEEKSYQPNSIDHWKDEAESLRLYCYGKEREIESLEGLKTELMIQDDIKEKEISQLKEELKATKERAQELKIDNHRLGGKIQ